MSRYCFDIETDGLLDDITRVHCVVLKDIDTTEIFKYGPLEVLTALDKITQASLLIGHNIIGYDIPALVKFYNCTIEAEQ